LEKTALNPVKYLPPLIPTCWPPTAEGRIFMASKRLRREMGSTNPMKAMRQPHRPAMNPIIGAPTTADRAAPAMINPIALARLSRGKYDATSVVTIGATIPKPSPERE